MPIASTTLPQYAHFLLPFGNLLTTGSLVGMLMVVLTPTMVKFSGERWG
jgi:hypothetical protein